MQMITPRIRPESVLKDNFCGVPPMSGTAMPVPEDADNESVYHAVPRKKSLACEMTALSHIGEKHKRM